MSAPIDGGLTSFEEAPGESDLTPLFEWKREQILRARKPEGDQ